MSRTSFYCAAAASAMLLGAPRLSAGQATHHLTIAHINDHHSHMEEHSFKTRDVPSGYLSDKVPDYKVSYGGISRIATQLKALKAEAEANQHSFLKLHAGDALVGTLYYSLFRGEVDARVMKTLCLDAMGLGNHEFDGGDANLAEFIKYLTNATERPTWCPSAPSIVAANLKPGAASPLKTLQNSNTIVKSVVKCPKTTGGVCGDSSLESFGIVGINIRNKTMTSSSPDAGTEIEYEVASAQAEIAKLKARGVKQIVLITHIGYANDLAWMAPLADVDVILGGDSHSLLGNETEYADVGFPSGPYPTLQTVGNRKVCVVQAWEYVRGVGKLVVGFNAQGEVETCAGETIIPINDTLEADITTQLTSSRPGLVKAAKDTEMETTLQVFANQVDVLKKRTITTVPEDLCLERVPGQGKSSLCPPNKSAERGGAVCNLVAKGFLMQEKGADIAIQNAGGCRTDIAKGNLTYAGVYEVLPFANTLIVLNMTGAEVKKALEDGVTAALNEGTTGAYPYASGVRFTVDNGSAAGSHVKDVEINRRVSAGSWTPLADTDVVQVLAHKI